MAYLCLEPFLLERGVVMNARDQQMFVDFAMINTTLILAMILQTAALGTEFTFLNGVLLGMAIVLDVVFMISAYRRSRKHHQNG
jgi:hypothetical protein